MRQVTDLLVGGGSYRIHRNEKGTSKLVLLHGAARFQLVLVSQWTVATILGLRAEMAPDDRKVKCTTRLDALDVPRSSAYKAKEFVGFRTLFSHLFVRGKIA